jgi:hypothetical protein
VEVSGLSAPPKIPRFSPQSLVPPRSVKVNPAIARGNQSLKESICHDSNAKGEKTKAVLGSAWNDHSSIS